MAQFPKYPSLGETKNVRLPVACVTHVLNICKSYDNLCVTHGIDKVTELQEKIEQGIDNYLDKIE